MPNDRAESEQQRLQALLAELALAVEELLLSGLTAASKTTLAKLEQGFRQASAMKLLRLGSTLRIANQEIKRFVDDDPSFSERRYVFFLNRSWLLSRALLRALREDDQSAWQRLTLNPQPQAIAGIRAVTMGVSKKHVEGVFCAFDFYLRLLSPKPRDYGLGAEQLLVWSCVFPLNDQQKITPEAFLNFDQPQKFQPRDWLPGQRVIEISEALLDATTARLTLSEKSRVSYQSAELSWPDPQHWGLRSALAALEHYQPQPLDLEIEQRQPLILQHWRVGAQQASELDDHDHIPIDAHGQRFQVVAADNTENRALLTFLRQQQNTNPRPLFGLLHCQLCRLILQPLTLLAENGPQHLMLEENATGLADLLRQLKGSANE